MECIFVLFCYVLFCFYPWKNCFGLLQRMRILFIIYSDLKIIAGFEGISCHRFVLLLDLVLAFLSKKSGAFQVNILCMEKPSAKLS